MKKLLPLCVLVVVLGSLSACSKKSDTASAAAPPSNSPATANAPTPSNPPAAVAAANALPAVTKAIQRQQYETAVDTLVQMKPATAQMTDAQRLQYQQAVRDATTALLGVKERDPAAKAAYEKLSRSATGR